MENATKQQAQLHLRVSPNIPASGVWCGGRVRTNPRLSLRHHRRRRRHPRPSAPSHIPPWGFRLTRASPRHNTDGTRTHLCWLCVHGQASTFHVCWYRSRSVVVDCTWVERWCSSQVQQSRGGRGRGRDFNLQTGHAQVLAAQVHWQKYAPTILDLRLKALMISGTGAPATAVQQYK